MTFLIELFIILHTVIEMELASPNTVLETVLLSCGEIVQRIIRVIFRRSGENREEGSWEDDWEQTGFKEELR